MRVARVVPQLAWAFILLASAWTSPLSGQSGCRALPDPRRLPALDSLVDSTTLIAAIAEMSPVRGRDVLIGVDTRRNPVAFAVDSIDTDQQLLDAMAHVTTALRVNAGEHMPNFRLRIRSGQPAAVKIERSMLCAPRSQQGTAGGPKLAFTVDRVGPGLPATPRPRSITPRLRIDAGGVVREVDLGAGSGDPRVDDSLRRSLADQRYRPALLDGRPVEVWVEGTRVNLVR